MKTKTAKKPKLKKGLVKCSVCPLVFPLSFAHVTEKGILCSNCVCKEQK